MSEWGWMPERHLGIWRYGAGWLKPVMAAVPFVTVCLLLLMLLFVSGTMSSASGVLFDLPEGSFEDRQKAGLVALVMPVSNETMVFFDDTRYQANDETSLRTLSSDLTESVRRAENKSLLLLVDRRVSAGTLMGVISVARKSGVAQVLVAGKQSGDEK